MGGSKPSAPTFITPPPPQITQAPAPNIQETSGQLAQSQLQYNPQLTQQAVQLSGQYGPQLAQQQFDLQSQYGPQYRQLYENLFPSQVQGQEVLAQQALQRLQSPQGLTPQQQAAQDTMRQRGQDRLLQGIRSQANLGGNLYSGNRERLEREGLAELETQNTLQDINLAQQQRGQTLQELIASSQVVFPQVQQPNVPNYGQGVTPNPDALLAAMLQGQIVQQPIYQPGNPGTPGFFGSYVQGYRGI